jgi:hypothetical protein
MDVLLGDVLARGVPVSAFWRYRVSVQWNNAYIVFAENTKIMNPMVFWLTATPHLG